MKLSLFRPALLTVLFVATCLVSAADDVSEEIRAKIEEWTVRASGWAASPVIVEAVAAQNTRAPALFREMTQEKWAELTALDPFVRQIVKSPAGQFLRSQKTEIVTEAFVSDARGRKVAFLEKTTRWSHLGQTKHDLPMKGAVWRGKLELDRSSGMLQMQLAVPVLKDGKAIGSLVVGLGLSEIASNE